MAQINPKFTLERSLSLSSGSSLFTQAKLSSAKRRIYLQPRVCAACTSALFLSPSKHVEALTKSFPSWYSDPDQWLHPHVLTHMEWLLLSPVDWTRTQSLHILSTSQTGSQSHFLLCHLRWDQREEVFLLLSQWILVQVFHLQQFPLMSYPEVFILLTTRRKERKEKGMSN